MAQTMIRIQSLSKELKNKGISLTEAKQLIKNNIKPKKTVAIKDVVKIIADG